MLVFLLDAVRIERQRSDRQRQSASYHLDRRLSCPGSFTKLKATERIAEEGTRFFSPKQIARTIKTINPLGFGCALVGQPGQMRAGLALADCGVYVSRRPFANDSHNNTKRKKEARRRPEFAFFTLRNPAFDKKKKKRETKTLALVCRACATVRKLVNCQLCRKGQN